MRKSILLSCLVFSLASPAFADYKPGQGVGVRKCTGTSGDISIDVTSKRTIGVASCKLELQKKFVLKGVCIGKKKGEKVDYEFIFGNDKDPAQAKGTHYVWCR